MTSPRKSRDPKDPEAGDATDPWRVAALGIRRNVGGPVSHPRLSLRHDGAFGGALQGRRSRLHLFALRQSDGDDVRAADGAPRRRRGGAGDRERDGRGHRGADGPAQGRRPHRRRAGPVRLVPLCGRGSSAALRRRLDHCRRRRSRRLAGGDAAQRPGRRSSNRRPIRRSNWSTSRASPRSCIGPARRSWSTTCSRPLSFSIP